jgi:hypothetical protein
MSTTERSADDRACIAQYARVFGSVRAGQSVSVDADMFKPTRSAESLIFAIDRAREAGDTELLEALRCEYRYTAAVSRPVHSCFVDDGVMDG